MLVLFSCVCVCVPVRVPVRIFVRVLCGLKRETDL